MECPEDISEIHLMKVSFKTCVSLLIFCFDDLSIGVSGVFKKVKVKSLSHVRLFATPWTVAYQAPLSMGFTMQQYWSGLPYVHPT